MSLSLGALSVFRPPRNHRHDRDIAVDLDHTVVAARDARESATFLAEILGLAAPVRFGPFLAVATGNGVTLDFAEVGADDAIAPQHYAFLISDADLDGVHDRVSGRGLQIWADPHRHQPRETSAVHGRGFSFLDPSGHLLQVVTVPSAPW